MLRRARARHVKLKARLARLLRHLTKSPRDAKQFHALVELVTSHADDLSIMQVLMDHGGYQLLSARWAIDERVRTMFSRFCCNRAVTFGLLPHGLLEDLLLFIGQDSFKNEALECLVGVLYVVGRNLSYNRHLILHGHEPGHADRWLSPSMCREILGTLVQVVSNYSARVRNVIVVHPLIAWLQEILKFPPSLMPPREMLLDAVHITIVMTQEPWRVLDSPTYCSWLHDGLVTCIANHEQDSEVVDVCQDAVWMLNESIVERIGDKRLIIGRADKTWDEQRIIDAIDERFRSFELWMGLPFQRSRLLPSQSILINQAHCLCLQSSDNCLDLIKRGILNDLVSFWRALKSEESISQIAKLVSCMAKHFPVAVEMTRCKPFLVEMIEKCKDTTLVKGNSTWSCLFDLVQHDSHEIRLGLIKTGLLDTLSALCRARVIPQFKHLRECCGILKSLSLYGDDQLRETLAGIDAASFLFQVLNATNETSIQEEAWLALRELSRTNQAVQECMRGSVPSTLEKTTVKTLVERAELAERVMQVVASKATSGVVPHMNSALCVLHEQAITEMLPICPSEMALAPLEVKEFESTVDVPGSHLADDGYQSAESSSSDRDCSGFFNESDSPFQAEKNTMRTSKGCECVASPPQNDLQKEPMNHSLRLRGQEYLLQEGSLVVDGRHKVLRSRQAGPFGRQLMIKIYEQEMSAHGVKEANALVGLTGHVDWEKYVVNCIDFSDEAVFEGRQCSALVMELGKTNLKHIAEGYGDSAIKAFLLPPMVKIAECLCFLHVQAGMVHGDVKLENVVNFGGDLPDFKLIDFENCCAVGEKISLECTAEYCPPELAVQLVDQDASRASQLIASGSFDVWCFGVLWIKYLMHGRVLMEFQGENPCDYMSAHAILCRIAQPDFSFEQTLDILQVSTPVKQLIRSCTACEPTARPTFRDILNNDVLRGVKTTLWTARELVDSQV